MAGFTCPFCGMVMAINQDTHQARFPSFEADMSLWGGPNGRSNCQDSTIRLDYYKCPNCVAYTLSATGLGKEVNQIDTIIQPNSFARQYPDYIPQPIRNDYQEACAILYLSPKSSATLARRCLQGMIRDFWGISKTKLYDEISELKDKIPLDLWNAIDSLRALGNIGAHMEKDTNLIIDIDVDESQKLIKLIEVLMKEWYVNRQERQELFGEIMQTNESKQAQRKNSSL